MRLGRACRASSRIRARRAPRTGRRRMGVTSRGLPLRLRSRRNTMDALHGKRLWRDWHRPRDLGGRRMNPAYGFVGATVLLTVYAQVIIKWQVGKVGHFPSGTSARLHYLGHFVLNRWVISALLGGLLAAFSWIAALSRLELSRAYPFTAASFVLILVLSAIFFDEALTSFKIAGALLIVLGLIVASQT